MTSGVCWAAPQPKAHDFRTVGVVSLGQEIYVCDEPNRSSRSPAVFWLRIDCPG
jgi:hypothetical protein